MLCALTHSLAQNGDASLLSPKCEKFGLSQQAEIMKKVLSFFFFCAPSFTRVIFDFRQRKIKSERHTPATVAFQAASVSQHEKTKTARQTAREKSEAFCHSKHPPSPNNAVALPLQYIRNQLFMERSRELFNLFLLSN